MNTHDDLTQGTVQWHAHRATHFNASDAPAMPQLVARIAGNEQGNTLTARWRLKVKYVRGNGERATRNQPTDTVLIPEAVSGTPQWTTPILFSSEWQMFQHSAWINEVTQNGFFGGDAELYCWVTGQEVPSVPNGAQLSP